MSNLYQIQLEIREEKGKQIPNSNYGLRFLIEMNNINVTMNMAAKFHFSFENPN